MRHATNRLTDVVAAVVGGIYDTFNAIYRWIVDAVTGFFTTTALLLGALIYLALVIGVPLLVIAALLKFVFG